jgi:hypothetical protein
MTEISTGPQFVSQCASTIVRLPGNSTLSLPGTAPQSPEALLTYFPVREPMNANHCSPRTKING